MTYYIYIAVHNSLNESRFYGYNSLSFVESTESWEEAYKVMVREGENLRSKGYTEMSKTRSEGYCYDSWLEPMEGKDWKDGHGTEIIASTSELSLQERQ